MLMAATEDGESMSNQQLRDEIMTLVMAGHETTANALAWCFHSLSKAPQVERKLRAEIAEVLGERAPTLEDLPKLKYTKQVLEETMRLYPPAWAFERRAIEADRIGGYDVQPGTTIAIAPFILHRNPKYWENPEGFDPDRFTPERAEGRPKFAYLPFGGGPRVCIGNGFAMMEAQLILARTIQRYRVSLVAGREVKMDPVVTLRPRGGLTMTLERASDLAKNASGKTIASGAARATIAAA
jgi:cytochrome P450